MILKQAGFGLFERDLLNEIFDATHTYVCSDRPLKEYLIEDKQPKQFSPTHLFELLKGYSPGKLFLVPDPEYVRGPKVRYLRLAEAEGVIQAAIRGLYQRYPQFFNDEFEQQVIEELIEVLCIPELVLEMTRFKESMGKLFTETTVHQFPLIAIHAQEGIHVFMRDLERQVIPKQEEIDRIEGFIKLLHEHAAIALGT